MRGRGARSGFPVTGGAGGGHGEGAPFVRDLPDRVNELGAFIREQRNTARLSLRRLSELAGVSNPYLSQIERGLRRPSAEILQQIAKALRISAETLYVQAGILERPDGETDLARYILSDRHLSEDQKQALLRIYLSFRHEHDPPGHAAGDPAPTPPDGPPDERAAERPTPGAPGSTTVGTNSRASSGDGRDEGRADGAQGSTITPLRDASAPRAPRSAAE
jgi:transcriptional regulator with XRE-family HTH domain